MARLLEEEEIYWHQRSRENWLKWGDRNTKWFHHKASERRKRNTVRGIMRNYGVWVGSESDVESVFLDYFHNIFSSSEPSLSQQSVILDHIRPVISPGMNARLLEPFSREEIERVVKQIFPTKAPGLDGSLLFFTNPIGILLELKLWLAVLRCLIMGNPSEVGTKQILP